MDLVVFLPLLIILGAFMFFASRRQKKAMQATIDLHNSLQIGTAEMVLVKNSRLSVQPVSERRVAARLRDGRLWRRVACAHVNDYAQCG